MIDFLKWTLLNEHNGNNAIMILKVISISKVWHYGLIHSDIDFTKNLRETGLVKGRTLQIAILRICTILKQKFCNFLIFQGRK